MSRFNRRADEPGAGAPVRTADISDPAVPDSLRRVVRPTAGRAYPHVLTLVGDRPRVLVAARPEAFVHVSFADEGEESSAAFSVAFVPWAQVEEIRVTGVSITFKWSSHSAVVEMKTHEEALQTVLFFLDTPEVGR